MNNSIQTDNQSVTVYLVYEHLGAYYSVPKSLVTKVKQSALDLADSAPKGKPLTLKQHFGKKPWESICDGHPVLAGYAMAYLVAKHQVPFKAMGIDRGSKAQMYALI